MSDREITIRKINRYCSIEINVQYDDSAWNEISRKTWLKLRDTINGYMKTDYERGKYARPNP